jgi:hypothetical protein
MKQSPFSGAYTSWLLKKSPVFYGTCAAIMDQADDIVD